MVVELISVGTELLLGNIVNTNAAYLAEKCAFMGFSCYHQTTVGDNKERLKNAINMALKDSDIVILSGGLGPTEDDLTKETAAEIFDLPLEMNEEVKQKIEEYFAKNNKDIPDNNWKQAMIPKGAIVLNNENGTAPGVIMEKDGKIMILLPGPPVELVPMFEEQVMPYLFEKTNAVIVSQIVKICGISESEIENQIRDLTSGTNPTVATYAKTGEVHIRVTAKEETEKAAVKLVKGVVKELKSRFGGNIYTTKNEETLEESVVDLLLKNELTLATVESCTGGMVAARIINVPGASDVYKEGFVTYSNKAKKLRIGVNKRTLKKYGAVSEETAKEMSRGGCFFSKADVCIATTGIAGPGGGTDEKPVGLVYISCTVCGETEVKEFHFKGNRRKVRENATAQALTMLRMCVLKYYSEKTFS